MERQTFYIILLFTLVSISIASTWGLFLLSPNILIPLTGLLGPMAYTTLTLTLYHTGDRSADYILSGKGILSAALLTALITLFNPSFKILIPLLLVVTAALELFFHSFTLKKEEKDFSGRLLTAAGMIILFTLPYLLKIPGRDIEETFLNIALGRLFLEEAKIFHIVVISLVAVTSLLLFTLRNTLQRMSYGPNYRDNSRITPLYETVILIIKAFLSAVVLGYNGLMGGLALIFLPPKRPISAAIVIAMIFFQNRILLFLAEKGFFVEALSISLTAVYLLFYGQNLRQRKSYGAM